MSGRYFCPAEEGCRFIVCNTKLILFFGYVYDVIPAPRSTGIDFLISVSRFQAVVTRYGLWLCQFVSRTQFVTGQQLANIGFYTLIGYLTVHSCMCVVHAAV